MVKFILGISTVFLLLLIGAYFLPSEFSVARSQTINAGHNTLYAWVNNLKKWNEWTAWNNQKDPTLQIAFGAITEGKGATQVWNGKEMGNGKITITESYPLEGIKYELLMNNQFQLNGQIRFTPDLEANRTQVEWITSGSMGNNPVFRYFRPFLDKWIGKDLEEGLQKLKLLAETNATQNPDSLGQPPPNIPAASGK
ncbi:hypothetical protein C7N43_03595 [Sphingobacteriales bacterium UPWRP_1]|nr:hypothetical protein BVG80_08005 [Sphingobacteriales bacterium TSM_CSM]PSJ78427.1 hypothetical protein C7N43_03595 [Sphingobacteriales bacterium UPWRP_1]